MKFIRIYLLSSDKFDSNKHLSIKRETLTFTFL